VSDVRLGDLPLIVGGAVIGCPSERFLAARVIDGSDRPALGDPADLIAGHVGGELVEQVLRVAATAWIRSIPRGVLLAERIVYDAAGNTYLLHAAAPHGETWETVHWVSQSALLAVRGDMSSLLLGVRRKSLSAIIAAVEQERLVREQADAN
jgi:hypothetical protein